MKQHAPDSIFRCDPFWRCYSGDEGGGGDVVVIVAAAANKGGGAWRRWVVDLIDRDTGSHFEVRRKRSPEKFSGGGGGWSAAAENDGRDGELKWIWRTATAAMVEMVVTWCGGSEVVLAVVMMRGDEGGGGDVAVTVAAMATVVAATANKGGGAWRRWD
nr:hypothetical protein [Tanacetum cinerariifolium]